MKRNGADGNSMEVPFMPKEFVEKYTVFGPHDSALDWL